MRKKTYLKVIEIQTEQSQKHLDEVRSIYREMRGYKHDFRHHLQTLKGYMEVGEFERALSYLDELEEDLQDIDNSLKTGNVTVDVILSGKLAQAKISGIPVTMKASVPAELTLSDVELSIIFGNLLDNAMDACTASDEEPFIRIYIAMKGNMLYFSMLNSATAKKKKHGTLFSSNKNETSVNGHGKTYAHGHGLVHVERIISHHGGWIKFNSEDGAFTTEFLVPVR